MEEDILKTNSLYDRPGMIAVGTVEITVAAVAVEDIVATEKIEVSIVVEDEEDTAVADSVIGEIEVASVAVTAVDTGEEESNVEEADMVGSDTVADSLVMVKVLQADPLETSRPVRQPVPQVVGSRVLTAAGRTAFLWVVLEMLQQDLFLQGKISLKSVVDMMTALIDGDTTKEATANEIITVIVKGIMMDEIATETVEIVTVVSMKIVAGVMMIETEIANDLTAVLNEGGINIFQVRGQNCFLCHIQVSGQRWFTCQLLSSINSIP